MSLSTDDPGVLVSTIGNEYEIMNQKVFSDIRWDYNMTLNGIKHAFIDDSEKIDLMNRLFNGILNE